MSKKNGKKKRLTDEQTRILNWQITADLVAKMWQSAFQWGSLLGCVYFTMDALKAYAGLDTFADLNFSVLMSKHLATVLGIIFGSGGIFVGYRERKLRKDTVEEMHKYQLLYEKNIDPGRSSSELTKRGDTRAEDT